jgi:sortase A
VLNGHNNIYGSVFKDLIELEPGDMIIVHDNDSIHEYRVVEKKVLPENGQPPSVRMANARWIGPSGDERITLVSCWPFTSNKNRIIVVARPVKNG